MSPRDSASGVPAKSATAIREWVAPTSATRMIPPSRLNARTVGLRPPVDGASPASTSQPRWTSASTRCETVERARPVISASSARVFAFPATMSRNRSPEEPMETPASGGLATA